MVEHEPSLSHDQLFKAFRWIEDVFYRLMLESDYILLGDTADSTYNLKKLRGDHIDVGIEKKYLTHEVKSKLYTDELMRSEVEDISSDEGGFVATVYGVPVRVKFLQNKNRMLTNPDRIFAYGESYQVPNPFDEYNQRRELVS